MPAWASAKGKVVVFFQDSGKFKYRFYDPRFPGRREPRAQRLLADLLRDAQVNPFVEKQVVALVPQGRRCSLTQL